jgi:hypothetical protein
VDTKLQALVAVQINMLSSGVSYILSGNIKTGWTGCGKFE